MVSERVEASEERLKNVRQITFFSNQKIVEAQLHEKYAPDQFMKLTDVEQVSIHGKAEISLMQDGKTSIMASWLYDDVLDCYMFQPGWLKCNIRGR